MADRRRHHTVPVIDSSPEMMPLSHVIRDPIAADLPTLGALWHDGWHEAHAPHVAEALTRTRTLEDFDRRLRAMLKETRVAGAPGNPLGFCTLRDDELMHLFVSPGARGSGMATALLKDGEARLQERGVQLAWLACIIGNNRTARFYERENWIRKYVMTYLEETCTGRFPLEKWRYEKVLEKGGRSKSLSLPSTSSTSD